MARSAPVGSDSHAGGPLAQSALAGCRNLAINRRRIEDLRDRAMKHSVDYFGSARPVIALDDEYPAGFTGHMHHHERIQILYASSGVMSVTTPETSFVVPPQRAVWLPANMPHEVSCRGPVSLRTLYLEPGAGRDPQRCRVFEVSDFLKALILEVVTFDPL